MKPIAEIENILSLIPKDKELGSKDIRSIFGINNSAFWRLQKQGFIGKPQSQRQEGFLKPSNYYSVQQAIDLLKAVKAKDGAEKEKKEVKLLDCPICGGKKIATLGLLLDGTKEVYYTYCSKCFVTGGSRGNVEGAKKLWNKFAREKNANSNND